MGSGEIQVGGARRAATARTGGQRRSYAFDVAEAVATTGASRFLNIGFPAFSRETMMKTANMQSTNATPSTTMIAIAQSGIDAAAANMSLGAIDNYRRFLEKPTLAPAAAAEILAIPEIWGKRLFSIVDLSEFQFARGGRFDAEFIGRDPKLLFGENPFAVDFFVLRRLTEARTRGGFSSRKPKEVLLFRYARELGLGDVGRSRYFEIP